jgi:hypothetical protein
MILCPSLEHRGDESKALLWRMLRTGDWVAERDEFEVSVDFVTLSQSYESVNKF